MAVWPQGARVKRVSQTRKRRRQQTALILRESMVRIATKHKLHL